VKAMLINLSKRPFVNSRPVKRVAAVCWALGLLLAGLNVYLYTQHLAGQGEQRQMMADVERQLAEESAALAKLESEVADLGLERQNEQIRFLNTLIEERTFSWSELFDRLAEVLPAKAQLNRINPRIESDRRQATRNHEGNVPNEEYAFLSLAGTAEDSATVLELLDALFAHPRFLNPDLANQKRRDDDGREDFNLSVLYLPMAREEALESALPGEREFGTDPGEDLEVTAMEEAEEGPNEEGVPGAEGGPGIPEELDRAGEASNP